MESTFEKIRHSFGSLLQGLNDSFFELIPGLLLLLFIIAIAIIIEYAVRIFLRVVRIDRWLEKTGIIKVLHTLGVQSRSNVIIGKWAFWITFIILLESVARVREWASISGKFSEFVIFIPKLIGAIVIILIGMFISNFVRRSVSAILVKAGSKAATILANISYYSVMIISVTIALDQVGFDTSLITASVSILLGAVLFAFSLSFVFASKDLLANIVSSSYNRSNYYVGQKVKITGIEGEIIKITNISVMIRTSEKILVIPARKFTEEFVEING